MALDLAHLLERAAGLGRVGVQAEGLAQVLGALLEIRREEERLRAQHVGPDRALAVGVGLDQLARRAQRAAAPAADR